MQSTVTKVRREVTIRRWQVLVQKEEQCIYRYYHDFYAIIHNAA